MQFRIVKLAAMVAIPLAFSGCTQENLETESDFPDNLAASEAILMDVEEQATYKSDPSLDLGDAGTEGNCPVLTWAQPAGTYPNTLTIDYGESCDCVDGRVKSGQIIVEMTDMLMNDGAVRTIELVDFEVNGHSIEAERTVTNVGLNSQNQLEFTVSGSHSASFCNGNTRSIEVEHVRTLIGGGETATPQDDVYSITGMETGVGRRGNVFVGNIVEPLIKSRDCRWVTQGIHKIETSDGKIRTVNYGDGECDDTAEVTRPDGSTRSITLRR